MDALHAWLDEGRRLLDAQRDDVPDSVRTVIGAAIDRSREAMAAQQDGRPKRRISRAATQTGATLASAFLDPKSLSALAACSRAMKKIARAKTLWNTHTAREYPEAATLRTLGGVDALVGQQGYARMRRLWHPSRDSEEPLGLGGYDVLVVMQHGSDTIINGLFDLHMDHPDPETAEQFTIDVGTGATGAVNGLDSRDIVVCKTNKDFRVKIALVRKHDGALLHIARDLNIHDVEDKQDVEDNYILMYPDDPRTQLPLSVLGVLGRHCDSQTNFKGLPSSLTSLATVCLESQTCRSNDAGQDVLSSFTGVSLSWFWPNTDDAPVPCRTVLDAIHHSKGWV